MPKNTPHKYRKEFDNCLCGCGRKVRQYPSRPSKFYRWSCYVSYMAKVSGLIKSQTHISYVLDEKKAV